MHSGQFVLQQADNLGFRRGEYLLDFFDIQVPKNTLDLILILIQVHMQKFKTYSPNRIVDREIVLHLNF